MPFEPQTLPINGSVTTVVLDAAGQNPSPFIIQIPDAWAVRVRWTVAGDAVPMLAPAAQWHVGVSLESLGPGLEAQVGSLNELVGAPAVTHTYDKVINVPGNFPGLTPGAYKLVTVLTLENGGVPCPIAAYSEGPVLQFYQYP